MAAITGMAHVIITVNNWQRSAEWYRQLLGHLGLSCVADTDRGHGDYDTKPFLYYVGGKTAIGLHESLPEFRDERFHQRRVGLHHICLRARSAEVIHELEVFFHRVLQPIGGVLVRPAAENHWAPGYFSLLLEDPEGMRVEVNHVPGKGLLAMDAPEVGDGGTGLKAKL